MNALLTRLAGVYIGMLLIALGFTQHLGIGILMVGVAMIGFSTFSGSKPRPKVAAWVDADRALVKDLTDRFMADKFSQAELEEAVAGRFLHGSREAESRAAYDALWVATHQSGMPPSSSYWARKASFESGWPTYSDHR